MLSLVYLILFTLVLAKAADIVIVSTSKLSKYLGIGQVTMGLVISI